MLLPHTIEVGGCVGRPDRRALAMLPLRMTVDGGEEAARFPAAPGYRGQGQHGVFLRRLLVVKTDQFFIHKSGD